MSLVEPVQNNRRFTLILIIIALTVTFVLVIDSLTYQYLLSLVTPEQSEETETLSLRNLPGTLVFAGAVPATPNSEERYVVPFTYTFRGEWFEYPPVDQLAGATTGNTIAYQHSYSPNGNYITFSGIVDFDTATTTPAITSLPYEIYQTEVPQTDDIDAVVRVLQEAEPITSDAETTKQYPRVSDAGGVVYMAREPGTPEELYVESPAETWAIYYAQSGTSSEMLTNGAYPVWVDESRFIFLKNDGIYLYDLSDGVEKNVWSSGGSMVTALGFLDVSPDGTHVAWADASGATLHMFDVVEANDNIFLEEQVAIVDLVRTAVFSHDGKYLAVQATGINSESGEPELTTVQFYDATTLTQVTDPLVFDTLDPGLTFLTDWQ